MLYLYGTSEFIKCQYILLLAVDTMKCKSVYLSSTHKREYIYRVDNISPLGLRLISLRLASFLGSSGPAASATSAQSICYHTQRVNYFYYSSHCGPKKYNEKFVDQAYFIGSFISIQSVSRLTLVNCLIFKVHSANVFPCDLGKCINYHALITTVLTG